MVPYLSAMPTPSNFAFRFITALVLGLAASTAPAAGGEGMDLRALESRLRETRAIDPIAKLRIKGQIDELLSRLREAHEAGASENVSALRQPYERVIGNIQAKLERDPALASDIVSSREAIWTVLSDPNKFRIQTAKGAKTEPKATLVSTTAGR